MIGDCEICERKRVPCARSNFNGRPFACFVCRGDIEDPYCELENEDELRSNRLGRALADIRNLLLRAQARYLVRG